MDLDSYPDGTVVLVSPGYAEGDNYGDNLDCVWVVSSADTTANIRASFSDDTWDVSRHPRFVLRSYKVYV